MKKLASVISIFIAVFVLSVTAFASEIPDFELPVARMFKISHEDDFSPEEVYNYALENGFNGVLLDLRGSDSTDLYGEYLEISNNIQYFEYYVIIEEKHLDPLPKPGKHFVFTKDISEEAYEEYYKTSKSECLSFLLPFGDEKALETAKYFYGKGYFKTVFVENLLSCYSEYGYEQYLLDISKNLPGAKIITINDLGRVLVPVVRGDFFGDTFELCNQYLVNKINGFGFCVSDYSELIGNRNPAAGALISSFKNTVLDEYANFSIPEKLEITRPTGSSLNVSTEKYTIFGTSDPSKPLYMNGEEVERISQSGLFAVTVSVSKKAKTFTFSQGNISDSVKIKLGGESTVTSGTTKKLSSCYPSSAEIIKNGETSVTLSCVGPSGGKVSAKIGETKVSLEQVAYADSGVPARFKGTIDLSGEYSEIRIPHQQSKDSIYYVRVNTDGDIDESNNFDIIAYERVELQTEDDDENEIVFDSQTNELKIKVSKDGFSSDEGTVVAALYEKDGKLLEVRKDIFKKEDEYVEKTFTFEKAKKDCYIKIMYLSDTESMKPLRKPMKKGI